MNNSIIHLLVTTYPGCAKQELWKYAGQRPVTITEC